MSATDTQLRNRFHADNGADKLDLQPEKSPSAEEILIEKLDLFLSSIEQRLDSFDQYFKIGGADQIAFDPADDGKKQPELLHASGSSTSLSLATSHLRQSSSASLSSLKSFSIYNLNKVYEQLSMVKAQVLKTSVLNLEYLYKTLDDKYNDLFNQDGQDPHEFSFKNIESNRELLTNKIITNLTYFEQKLAHIDALIRSKTPQATFDYDADARFNHLKFYNFNKALKAAQDNYIHYYQIPLGWRENRYIIRGYRFNLHHREMLKSMFHFNHNETGNIWTHFIGALVMVYLGVAHFPSTATFRQNTTADNLVMYTFLMAALECLVSSVLWHTYSCFAQYHVRSRFACVDYTGITVLITCLVISAEYCSLYHYPKLLAFFVVFLVLCGMGGFFFNWSPAFDKPEYRPLRIGFYVTLAFLGSITFLFKWYYEGLSNSFYFYLPLLYKSFVWYWLGVVFYGGLIPERWRYDILINEDDDCSHTHSALEVLLGNVENSGAEELNTIRHELRGPCSQSPYTCRSSEHAPPQGSAHLVHERDPTCEKDGENLSDDAILRKHFPDSPTRTPYHNDFFSLWWVDYILLSHNIWHVCVVLGVVGHYFCIIGMFEKVHRLHAAV